MTFETDTFLAFVALAATAAAFGALTGALA